MTEQELGVPIRSGAVMTWGLRCFGTNHRNRMEKSDVLPAHDVFSDSLTTSVPATQLATALPAGADAVVAVRVPEDEWFTSCPSTPEPLTADAVIVQP